MKLNNQVQATLLFASFIWVLVAFQGCETTHVVHIHNGKPVPASGEQQSTVQAAATELPVDITMILDRSGSMGSLTETVISSYNNFLEEQKTVDGEAFVSLIQFDEKFEPNYSEIDIQNTNELNTSSYQPRGSTALFDAVGRAITEAKERITPGSSDVVFVITTDGLENASKEFTGDQIKEMIADCENQYGWHFMYLAANEDAFNQHKDMGLDLRFCQEIEATPEGWRASQQQMSLQLLEYRIERNPTNLEFDKEEPNPDDGY